MKTIVFLVLCSLLFSCKRPDLNIEIKNDFEKNTGWINQSSLKKDKAHSGTMACKLDSTHEFGIGYKEYFNMIKDYNFNEIEVNFWTNFDKPINEAMLVIEIDSAGKQIYWDGIHFEKDVNQADTWLEISKKIQIPQNKIRPENVYSLYFWSPRKETFFVDDLRINFKGVKEK